MSGFLKQLIIGLVVTTLFELWRARSVRKSHSFGGNPTIATELHSSKAHDNSKDSYGGLKSFIRLIISPFIGFFLAIATAGILEAEGHENIPLESSLALILIIIWTVVVWQLLYHFGPLKGKKT